MHLIDITDVLESSRIDSLYIYSVDLQKLLAVSVYSIDFCTSLRCSALRVSALRCVFVGSLVLRIAASNLSLRDGT
jgi:hypothetical protein